MIKYLSCRSCLGKRKVSLVNTEKAVARRQRCDKDGCLSETTRIQWINQVHLFLLVKQVKVGRYVKYVSSAYAHYLPKTTIYHIFKLIRNFFSTFTFRVFEQKSYLIMNICNGVEERHLHLP